MKKLFLLILLTYIIFSVTAGGLKKNDASVNTYQDTSTNPNGYDGTPAPDSYAEGVNEEEDIIVNVSVDVTPSLEEEEEEENIEVDVSVDYNVPPPPPKEEYEEEEEEEEEEGEEEGEEASGVVEVSVEVDVIPYSEEGEECPPDEEEEEEGEEKNIEIDISVEVDVTPPAEEEEEEEEEEYECVEVPYNEWDSPLIKSIIDYGTQWNVNKASSNGNFSSNSTWEIKEIKSVCKKEKGDKTYYTFVNFAQVQDGEKCYNFTSTITVRTYNGENFVTKWKYYIVEDKKQSNSSGNCVEVPSNEWNSALIKSIIDYGTQWNVNKASSRGNFSPNSSWEIKEIKSVCKKQDGDKTYYTFTNLAKVQDGDKSYSFTSTMTVRNYNGENFVTKWKYNVVGEKKQTNNGGSSGKCVNVPSSEWNSPLIKSVIDYGTQWNVNKASSRGNFSPSSSWEIKEIKNLCKKQDGDKTYYTFTNLAKVQDGDKSYSFTSTMTVRNYNGENFVTKWKYNVEGEKKQTNNGGTSGKCVNVPSSEWNSDLIKNVINYGTQWNVNKASSRGNFSSSSTWEIKDIKSVCKEVKGNQNYYTFTNLAKVQDGGKSYAFTSTMTVRNSGSENLVTKWKYDVKAWN